MGHKFHYDESGVTFYYFLLTLLGLVLVPTTLRLLLPSSVPTPSTFPCTCPACQRKDAQINTTIAKKSRFTLKNILLAIGWSIVVLIVYGIFTTTTTEQILYDPFAVLGLDSSASEATIKRQYRLLSLKYHPDKAEDKENAESAFVEISRAYQSLTDPAIRKNWEEFGNPDGIRSFSLGIALPAWLANSKNSFWILAIYGTIFGLMLPFYVGRWWARSKNYTKDGILHTSMALYYREMKEGMGIKKIIEILTASAEFKDNMGWKLTDSEAVSKLCDFVKEELEHSPETYEKSKKYTEPQNVKAHVLMVAHINRIPVSDPSLAQDQALVVEKSAHLVLGMIQIAIARDWLQTTLNCMTLYQMIAQAMAEYQPPIMQLPFITRETLKHCKTKKRNIRTVKDFLDLDEEEKKNLLRDLSPEDLANVVGVARDFPELTVVSVTNKILGQEQITTNGLITAQIKLRLRKLGSPFVENSEIPASLEDETNLEIDEDCSVSEKRQIAPRGAIVNPNDPIHAPYFPLEKRPFWWVLLGSKSNALLTQPVKLYDLVTEKTVSLQFKAPPKAMAAGYTLYVRPDSFLGIDIQQDIKFNVVSEETVPHSVFEDEISGDETETHGFVDDDATGVGNPN